MKRYRFNLRVLFLALALAFYSLSLGTTTTLAHTTREASGTGIGSGGALTGTGKARAYPINVAAITAAKLSGKIHANPRHGSGMLPMANHSGNPPAYMLYLLFITPTSGSIPAYLRHEEIRRLS